MAGTAWAAGHAAFAQDLAAPSPAPAASTAAPSAAAAAPSAGEPVVRLASKNERVKVVEKFSTRVNLDARIARVDGFDDAVVRVSPIDSRSVRLEAVSPGVTTMTLTDEHDQIWTVDVLVTGDVRHLQSLLTRMFPNAAVEAVEVRESVVLRGWVTEPSQITEIVEIAEQFYPRVLNQVRVGCVQQVMLKVKVMEVQRSKLEALGFNFIYTGQNGFLTSTPGGLAKINKIGATGATLADNSLAIPTALFGIVRPDSVFGGFVEALKQENLLKILAEPNLVTMNGRPANLLAGGEFPILVPNGLGTVGIEYKPFGVRLEAVPIVLSNSRVRVELQSEVSDQDLNNSVELQGFRVPALTQRRANTQVELNFGETLVIAGLINQARSATTSKIPVLGDIPYVGAAFSRKSFEEAETELIIMVTPELVGPLSPDQIPPGGPGLFTDSPTLRELGIYGHIEVPSYGPHCEAQCPPPFPTYDPHHPVGPEHLPPGPGFGPTYGPGPIPSPAMTPQGEMMMPGDYMPAGEALPATPVMPPPAPAPTTSSAAKAAVVKPASHRSFGRPGLIEPSRPAGQP